MIVEEVEKVEGLSLSAFGEKVKEVENVERAVL
jgi:hypothetical protein